MGWLVVVATRREVNVEVRVRIKATLFLMALALFAAQSAGQAAVIVDQSSGATGRFIGSQELPDRPEFSASAFDDFTIGTAFNITFLRVFGREAGLPAANVAVVAGIYASPDLTAIPILRTIGTQVGANLVFDFGGATLPAGTYWVGAYVVRPASGGQWLWNLRLPIVGSQARWHNPGDGFGLGTSAIPLGDVLEEADMAFILEGNLATSSLSLTLALNRDAVEADENLQLSATIIRPGGAVSVTLYLAIVLPGSVGPAFGCGGTGVLVFLANRGADFAVRCGSAPPETFPAYAENLAIPAGAYLNLPDILNLTWPAGAPSGLYTFALVATPPGAFADGSIDAQDLLGAGVDTLVAQ